METSERGPWIATFTGRRFYPLSPSPDDVSIEDIAHSLALQCRFNGHGEQFYSVAQHSVAVSKCVPAGDSLWGLLHDAAEAYLSDVVRPIKAITRLQCPAGLGARQFSFARIEADVLGAITRRYGMLPEMPESVQNADDRMLVTEAASLFERDHPLLSELPDVQPYPDYVDAECWDPATSEYHFLQRLREIAPEVLRG